MDQSQIDNLTGTLLEAFNLLRKTKLSQHNGGGLRGPEQHLLWIVESLREGKPVMPSDIARHLGVTSAAVTHHLNTLEEKGYISRSTSPEDGRIAFVSLTVNGMAALQAFRAAIKDKIRSLVEFLGEEDARTLATLITKVGSYMGEEPTHD